MTMTKLPTDVAFDLLVVEQLHDIVKCDDDGCGKTARWSLTCPGGEHIDVLCNEHRDEEDELNAATFKVVCELCRLEYPLPFPWVAV